MTSTEAVMARIAELRHRYPDGQPDSYVIGWLAPDHAAEIDKALDSYEDSMARVEAALHRVSGGGGGS